MSADIVIQRVEELRLPLVNRFYKDCRYSAKAGRGEQVYSLSCDGSMTAVVRLQQKSDQLFLRSMCVAPSMRGRGLGRELLLALLPALESMPSYCYPFSHLQGFYAQAGFVVSREDQVADFIALAYRRYRQQGRDIIIMTRPAKC